MDNEVRHFYEFGQYRLDPRRKLLLRNGDPVVLTSKAFETLLVLVQHSEQVVSKEELMRTLWPQTFVEDANLTQHISMVRKALGETPQDRRHILTLPGRGYCFAEAVRMVPEDGIERIAEDGDAEPTDALSGVPSTEERSVWLGPRAWATVAVVGLALVAGLALWLRHESRTRGQTKTKEIAQQKTMLVVLPFENLSSDPEQEYFSDGLTEETITDLGELNPDRLGVIARTSSTAYKHTDKTIAQIGRELGVDYVLEGSVRREGGIARISAQLIRVKDQAHLWAHTYERETAGLLALQNELGVAIAQRVEVKLTPLYGNRVGNKYSANAEAFELYLKGRYNLNKMTDPEIIEGRNYFLKSIAKDPGFALAYAGLADSYLASAIESPPEFDPKAKAAASRALELDDDLAEAHTALGTEKAEFEYDWQGAEQEFKRAIELNPNYAEAHRRYAWNYLTPLGKSDEAIAEMKKALELDPFSRIDNTIFGCVYLYARRYQQSEGQFNKAVQLNPDFFVTYYHFAWLYVQLGRYPDAITQVTQGRLLSPDERVKTAKADEAKLRKAFAAEGARGFWQEMMRERVEDSEIGGFGLPEIYARLGDKEDALKELERESEERFALGTLVNVDPAFDSLRSDPRFVDLVRRMGLAPSAKRQ